METIYTRHQWVQTLPCRLPLPDSSHSMLLYFQCYQVSKRDHHPIQFPCRIPCTLAVPGPNTYTKWMNRDVIVTRCMHAQQGYRTLALEVSDMEQPARIIAEDDSTQPGWCHNYSQDLNPSMLQLPTSCPAVYHVESKIWSHVAIIMYVSIYNLVVSWSFC